MKIGSDAEKKRPQAPKNHKKKPAPKKRPQNPKGKKPKGAKKGNPARNAGKAPRKQSGRRPAKKGSKKANVFEINIPVSKNEKLVDMGLISDMEFMTQSGPTMTSIHPAAHVEGRKFEVNKKPRYVSTIMKLVLSVVQSNDMWYNWSMILWNISQAQGLLPDDVHITFNRVFERKDNDVAKKEIGRRRKLAILSSESDDNVKRQTAAVAHDMGLVRAIDTGDSVLTFGAEAIVTAPDEVSLERAVTALKDYMNTNDETRGIKYEIDINKQNRPFLVYGPNAAVGNKDVFVELTSRDAAISALWVDAGGDRTPGSEYVGMSYGKLIRSYAAYNLANSRSLYVGNDTENRTYTLSNADLNLPSQIYWSKITSRSYLLRGNNVVHFVVDHESSAKHLMNFPVSDNDKVIVDVSKGLLNMLEPIDDGSMESHPERLPARFASHIDNIIVLLGQFRDTHKISTNDDFANITRDILVEFFVKNKYWSHDARYDSTDVRLFIRHEDFKRLADFGQYVAQRLRSNKDSRLEDALRELNTIVNSTILSAIPALDTKTDYVVDALVRAPYRVVDLTGMSVGSMNNVDNPSLNVMMISYLNLMLPSLKNGDVLFIHGFSRLSKIANVIIDVIESSGLNVDIVFTESNQNNAVRTMDLQSSPLDFTVVDLYSNRVDKLIDPLGMDADWVQDSSQVKGTFFIQTQNSLDYIRLDSVF